MTQNKSDKTKKRKNKKQKNITQCFYKPAWFWKIFLPNLGIVLSIITTIYCFFPKLSVHTTQPLDPYNPLSSPFIISNNSELPIYNVKFSYLFKNAKSSAQNLKLINVTTKISSFYVPKLLPGERTAIFICFPIKILKPLDYADIEITVSYRPSFIPWSQHKRIRFKTVLNSNKEIIWLPKNIIEK